MSSKMPWTDTIICQRPEEEFISVKKELVEGAVCPKCGSKDVRKYPIANYMGPRIVVKCQNCFNVLEMLIPKREDKWPPYCPVTHDWEVSLCERASRELHFKKCSS